MQASTAWQDRVTEVEKKRNSRNMGRLLERGLQAALPATHFPFAVRLTVDLLSADGSETMAALSAASLALADAGVPVEAHVAGLLPSRPFELILPQLWPVQDAAPCCCSEGRELQGGGGGGGAKGRKGLASACVCTEKYFCGGAVSIEAI